MTALSIRSLYQFALAEGEGVGTAYEYYVKRRVLRPVLSRTPRGGTVLIAGLPEKYGTSLDFVLAASERDAKVEVVDERPSALEHARKALSIPGASVEYKPVSAMRAIAELPRHDLALSCEVLQRLEPQERLAYASALRANAPCGVIFVPNGENESHTKISGLKGLTRQELASVMGPGVRVGFVDLPPFPPGITRSAAQREKASTGLAEAVAMWGLQAYARAERFAPSTLKRHVAHIVYAQWGV